MHAQIVLFDGFDPMDVVVRTRCSTPGVSPAVGR